MKKILLTVFSILFIACAKPQKHSANVNIMSFNIRIDIASDSLHPWQKRMPMIAQIIRQNNVDIVGMQELVGRQYNQIDSILPEYKIFGAAKNAQGQTISEFNGVLYNPKKLEIARNGVFWLTPTPDSLAGKGWDAAYERSAVWAEFIEKNTQTKFIYVNTHLDDTGATARNEEAKLILQKISALANGNHIILTGDFNCTEKSETIKIITDSTMNFYLRNAEKISHTRAGANYTFNGFGKLPENDCKTIDFIFVDKNAQVKSFAVIDKLINGNYPSDHFPIKANIEL